jgi:DNA-binding NtrC family response regulator
MSESKSILIIDDEAGLRDLMTRLFQDAGYLTASAPDGTTGLRMAREGSYDLVVLDMSLPKMSGLEVLAGIKEDIPDLAVIMVTAYGSTQTAIEALRLGAYDFIAKPFDLDELQLTAERALEQRRVIDENRFLREELKHKYGFDNIIGATPEVQKAYVLAAQVANTNATVLIMGETGTGKEYLARTIHYQSPRASGPFIKVNCAALPESLLESELFGHEKGAFTHAVARHIGRFESAHRGTIFLDEIGEVPLTVQTKLLRVLQEKQFERVGGSETLNIDVRVIAATNKDLQKAMKEKEFREDLFYRLNVMALNLPPLRHRKEDLDLFAHHFLKFFAHEMGRKANRFADDALDALYAHDWPGNIRELQNAIERSVILCNGEVIRREHLMLSPSQTPPVSVASAAMDTTGLAANAPLRDLENWHIRRVLEASAWNQSAASVVLGIDRKTLRNKIREFHIEKPES